jgi:signal transduction histidine kinase
MNNDFNENVKKIFNGVGTALKEILYIGPHAISSVFKAINKRLRFSITFKTTTIHTFSLTFILFFNTLLIVGGIFGLLVYQDYELMNRNIKSITNKIIDNDNSVPEEKLLELSKDFEIDISIFDKDRKVSFTTASNVNSIIINEKINSFDVITQDDMYYLSTNKRNVINDEIYYLQLRKSLMSYINIIIVSAAVVASLNLLVIISSAIRLSKTTKKMLRPIDNMTTTAKSISISELDKRLDVVQSHDELKELAETFNEMLDRIEHSYEQQNQFVSDASHELRTPIAVIQGYANMLNRWGKDDRAVLEESITAINSEAINMKELVEKLLFLARTDKNTQKLEKNEFPLNELIDEIARETRMIDSNHSFICERNDAVIIDADRALIKQALRVFIDNSIKYTPESGTIKLNSINIYNGIMITLQDNGIGIAKEDLPRIFDRFYRCDKARTRQTGGTGLGLSISKWIIGKHNGSIEVESTLNVGTKVIIYLPYN